MDFAGGNAFSGPFGVVYSREHHFIRLGIGAYSDEDLKRSVPWRPVEGGPLWVMPWSATMGLHEDDLLALIAACEVA
jgi:hypothetical protein